MELQRVFEKARAKQQQNQWLTTTDLMDKALYMETPWGRGMIMSVVYSHSRRVNGKTIKLYRITLHIGETTKRILTTENNVWRLTG